MLWITAMPVEHRRDLAGAPGTTGSALAELGAWLGSQTDLGHDALLKQMRGATPLWARHRFGQRFGGE